MWEYSSQWDKPRSRAVAAQSRRRLSFATLFSSWWGLSSLHRFLASLRVSWVQSKASTVAESGLLPLIFVGSICISGSVVIKWIFLKCWLKWLKKWFKNTTGKFCGEVDHHDLKEGSSPFKNKHVYAFPHVCHFLFCFVFNVSCHDLVLSFNNHSLAECSGAGWLSQKLLWPYSTMFCRISVLAIVTSSSFSDWNVCLVVPDRKSDSKQWY